MRDILAALLRSRGYTHDDANDPDDMFWGHSNLGVRPLLACVAYEMNVDHGHPVYGWNTYQVSTTVVGVRALDGAE